MSTTRRGLPSRRESRVLSGAAVIVALWASASYADDGEPLSQKVFTAAVSAVVKVEASGCAGRGDLASHGFFWQPSGVADDGQYVVTTLHSVAACKLVEVRGLVAVTDGNGRVRGRELVGMRAKAEVVRRLRSGDLALLKLARPLAGAGAPIAPSGNANVARGHALAAHDSADAVSSKPLVIRRSTETALGGVIGRKASAAFVGTGLDELTSNPVLLFDGNLTPGASGGPVVDESGKLLGIAEGGLALGEIGTCWATPANRLKELTAASDPDLTPAEATSLKKMFFADMVLDQNFGLHSVGRLVAGATTNPSSTSDRVAQASIAYAHGWELLASSMLASWAPVVGIDGGLRAGGAFGHYNAPDGSPMQSRLEGAYDVLVGGHVGVRLNRMKRATSLWRSLRASVAVGAAAGLSLRGESPGTLLQFPNARVALSLPISRTWCLGLAAALLHERGPSSSFRYRADLGGADRVASTWRWLGELGLAFEKEFD